MDTEHPERLLQFIGKAHIRELCTDKSEGDEGSRAFFEQFYWYFCMYHSLRTPLRLAARYLVLRI
jgi:hypothetical protein